MLRKGLLLLGLVLSASWATAAAKERTAPEDPLFNIVAVGLGHDEIVLATPAKPLSSLRWRFRAIPLAPGAPEVQEVRLSRSGTKILLVFAGGADRILDLTQPMESIGPDKVQRHTHRLPGQFFPVSSEDHVCLEDDSGREVLSSCMTGARASLHSDGSILYVSEERRIAVSHSDGRATEQLSYQIPEAARYELFAGHRGESPDFLILVRKNDTVDLIDPRRISGTLGSYDSWELASLHALLAFSPAPSDSKGPSTSEQTLRTWAGSLPRQSDFKSYKWSFFRVQPELPLYAPVLEFAQDEPVFTSDVEIWDTLLPVSEGTTKDAFRKAYDSVGQERFERCTTYYRTSSYPGSWLLEFWYYYPFDEGKPVPHIHDSEHLFVEVDKLGGTVRSVLASAHNSINPNNNYSTFVPSAHPVDLPLFAFVEFEKHAMSPDINRDGIFTRNIDENLSPEWFSVWGLRDLGAKRGHFMEPYRSWMSLPRRNEDRFALRSSSDYFPDLHINPERATCQLVPFHDRPPCKDCPIASVAAAESHLANHTDAKKAENIYKPWVLPWYQVRAGFDFWDHLGHGAQLYGAFVTDLAHLSKEKLPTPSRIALEAAWSPVASDHTVQSGGQSLTFRRSDVTYVGARFEQLLTNTQGVYFGVNPLFYKFGIVQVAGKPVPFVDNWRYEGVWYRTGYFLELPTRRFGNFTNYIGVSFPNFQILRFEWRMSFGILRRRGRQSFGIRSNDADPYQAPQN